MTEVAPRSSLRLRLCKLIFRNPLITSSAGAPGGVEIAFHGADRDRARAGVGAAAAARAVDDALEELEVEIPAALGTVDLVTNELHVYERDDVEGGVCSGARDRVPHRELELPADERR